MNMIQFPTFSTCSLSSQQYHQVTFTCKNDNISYCSLMIDRLISPHDRRPNDYVICTKTRQVLSLLVATESYLCRQRPNKATYDRDYYKITWSIIRYNASETHAKVHIITLAH